MGTNYEKASCDRQYDLACRIADCLGSDTKSATESARPDGTRAFEYGAGNSADLPNSIGKPGTGANALDTAT